MKCEEEMIPKIQLREARERGMFGLGLEHRVGEGEC
jgi:hypothetical protein